MHIGELGCKSTWEVERKNDLATEGSDAPARPEPIRFKDEYCALKARVSHLGSAGTPIQPSWIHWVSQAPLKY